MITRFVWEEDEEHPHWVDLARAIENWGVVPFEKINERDVEAICFPGKDYSYHVPERKLVFYDTPLVYRVEDFSLLSDPAKRIRITKITSEKVYTLTGGDEYEYPHNITNFFMSLIGKPKIPPTRGLHDFRVKIDEGCEDNIIPVSENKPTIVIPRGFEAYSKLKTLIEKLVEKD